jgi:serine kinase of HPr protein (carbohydrate metabolism regulator)
MSKKLTLKNIIRESSKKLGLKEIFANNGLNKEVTALKVSCYRRISFTIKKNVFPTIAILTPQAVNQLCLKEIKSYGAFFKNIIFIVIAKSQHVPDLIKKIAVTKQIPIASSVFDEYYLESSIKGLIQERICEKKNIHGVIIEIHGMGIIIVGASGIGKTTSALEYVQTEGYWIADDLVIVKKTKNGELIANGHPKIKNLLNHQEDGIISVANVLAADKIKKRTKLSAIIEVERTNIKGTSFTEIKRNIFGTILPCYKISISASGYFNQNLLENIIKKLEKGSQ